MATRARWCVAASASRFGCIASIRRNLCKLRGACKAATICGSVPPSARRLIWCQHHARQIRPHRRRVAARWRQSQPESSARWHGGGLLEILRRSGLLPSAGRGKAGAARHLTGGRIAATAVGLATGAAVGRLKQCCSGCTPVSNRAHFLPLSVQYRSICGVVPIAPLSAWHGRFALPWFPACDPVTITSPMRAESRPKVPILPKVPSYFVRQVRHFPVSLASSRPIAAGATTSRPACPPCGFPRLVSWRRGVEFARHGRYFRHRLESLSPVAGHRSTGHAGI